VGSLEENSVNATNTRLEEVELDFSGFTMTTANNPNNNLSPWKPG